MREHGEFKIIGPEEAPSYWQPVPANGFIRNILNREVTQGAADFAMGTQTLPPGTMIREHTHDRVEEVIHVTSGTGIARVEGVEHAIAPGSTVYVGLNVKHHFINTGSAPLTFLWLVLPGGLDTFFAEIGRPRRPGEPDPEPFPRPDNVAEIEARTVFGWSDKSFDTPSPQRKDQPT